MKIQLVKQTGDEYSPTNETVIEQVVTSEANCFNDLTLMLQKAKVHNDASKQAEDWYEVVVNDEVDA